MLISRFLGIGLACGALFGLSACMTTAPTAVHQPMTARPAPIPAAATTAGSIFGANSRPLFEDRRARYVGDTITVNLVEKTQASKSSNASASREAEIDVGAPVISGLPLKSALNKLGVAADNKSDFSGKGAAAANNAFTGTMTVTVIDTYPNGNLLVSGEKQIAINQGQEFIRFSGVVNPANVTSANTVQSTQVADARVEYKASGYIDEAQTMGWLQRFFLNVLPW